MHLELGQPCLFLPGKLPLSPVVHTVLEQLSGIFQEILAWIVDLLIEIWSHVVSSWLLNPAVQGVCGNASTPVHLPILGFSLWWNDWPSAGKPSCHQSATVSCGGDYPPLLPVISSCLWSWTEGLLVLLGGSSQRFPEFQPSPLWDFSVSENNVDELMWITEWNSFVTISLQFCKYIPRFFLTIAVEGSLNCD